jgi:prepilin-type N-terminal cleavage/methylation domain-containing protein/prepilin-type processing-associated H-X9-DG protein
LQQAGPIVPGAVTNIFKARKKAFTLIETLVTISVISVLVGVLIPALSVSRRQAKAVYCRNNLRQMVIAAHAYCTDNDDFYPIAYIMDPDPLDSVRIDTNWDFVHIKDWVTGQETCRPGLLWQGQTIEKVQQCPSFKTDENSEDPYTGYNYNTSYIGHGSLEAQKRPAKLTEVKRTTECVLFGDGQYYGGWNRYMRSPFRHAGDDFSFRAAGTQGFRHCGKTNIAFCDGRVDSQEEYYTETIPPEKANIERHNAANEVKVGFLSPDNSAYDLK